MAVAYKVLGQSAPSATTETTLYTVPGATKSIVSTLIICNISAVATTFRVSIGVGGASTVQKNYLYYDVPILGNDTFAATLGLTLAATDIVRIYAGNGNLAFNLFGQENS